MNFFLNFCLKPYLHASVLSNEVMLSEEGLKSPPLPPTPPKKCIHNCSSDILQNLRWFWREYWQILKFGKWNIFCEISSKYGKKFLENLINFGKVLKKNFNYFNNLLWNFKEILKKLWEKFYKSLRIIWNKRRVLKKM